MISDYFPETMCGSKVVVSDVPTDSAIDDLNKLGDLQIELNVAKGWRGGSLKFLKKLKNLKGNKKGQAQRLTDVVILVSFGDCSGSLFWGF